MRGTLKIVDLAGREKCGRSGTNGTAEENKQINKEIGTLSKCIAMLAQNEK
jgi:hypothetical protein